ncbi:MAG: ATP-dependent protease La domain-containing protein [Acidobacteria bacterium]|nr:MAG: ATP-dependent protease La domain-containing protein [Acidobacteriota bacterium]
MEKYLSLFPLDIVLFPEMILPLHIFEERYREMIGECILEKAPFGILYAHNESIEEIGCVAEISKVLKKYNDGRMDILTLGVQRFQVVYLDNERSYLRGVIEPYVDSEAAPLPSEEEARQVLQLYQEAFGLLNKGESEAINLASPYQGFSFKVASVLNLNNALKQQILVERSEKTRVETLLHHLEELVPRLKHAEQSARRARSNGNLMKNSNRTFES